MHLTHTLRSALHTLRLAILPLLVIATISVMGVMFHVRSTQVVEAQMRERMVNVVGVAALQFNGNRLRQIDGPEDTSLQAYTDAVAALQRIRELSPHVRFVYIMRRTDDPQMLAFVADADAALTPAQLDVNGNGVVDLDEESTLPGDLYPIAEIDTLRNEAFLHPTVDDDLTIDQWGTLISAYAPIRDVNGEAVAILGIDIEADEFFAMTQETFSIVAVVVVMLLGALLAAYMVIVIHQRRMEALRQLDVERTAFLDLATHQLGVPLATFRWWVELLKENKGKKAESADAIAQLEQGVQRMDAVLRALTDVTQMHDERIDYRPSKVSLRTIVRRAVADADAQLKGKHQTVTVKMEKNLPFVILDPKLFAGILHELIQNASFYSPDNTAIEVAVRREGRMVRVDVADHGYGIPEKDLPFVFDKFRRGSNAARHRPVGNGLGLYITKRVVDKSKGRVRITSELNHGTTVSIVLPAAS